jgi:hypothetical protein
MLKQPGRPCRAQQILAAKRRQRERDRQGLALYRILGHRELIFGLLVAGGYLRDGVAWKHEQVEAALAAYIDDEARK